MPAIFSDVALIPALERIGIPTPDARDYTNDGCWEVIIPGRTDFRFQRLSLMLCLEWALNRGCSRIDGRQDGLDTGDPRTFASFEEVWHAFAAQVDLMVSRTVARVVEGINERSTIAPVPLLSALIDGAISARCDMTAGGARYRTYGMLAEGAAYAIDSLVALKTVVFDEGAATMTELCDVLDADYAGHDLLRRRLLSAPKYGNDDERADSVGQRVIALFTEHRGAPRRSASLADQVPQRRRHLLLVHRHWGRAGRLRGRAAFRRARRIQLLAGLGRDAERPAGGDPVIRQDAKRQPARGWSAGSAPGASLGQWAGGHGAHGWPDPRVRGFRRRDADADRRRHRGVARREREPENYTSLRVRMGGWCAYFTMLSHEQQEHHIHRQEARS